MLLEEDIMNYDKAHDLKKFHAMRESEEYKRINGSSRSFES